MAAEDQAKNFMELVGQCIKTPIDELIERNDLGTANFVSQRNVLTTLFEILSKIEKSQIERLPSDYLNKMRAALLQVKEVLEQIEVFSLDHTNPFAVRDDLCGRLDHNIGDFYQTAAPWVPYFTASHLDVRVKITELEQKIESVTNYTEKSKKLYEDAERKVLEKESKIDEIIAVTREAAADAGVASFADDFRREACTHDGTAKLWLTAAMVGAVMTIIAAWILIYGYPLPKEASAAQIVQQTTGKIIFIGILFAATTWCGQMYRANLHQKAVNSFKANGLKTFQAFVQATDDEQIRDAVLLETTRAIFSPNQTGYVRELGRGARDSDTKIVEISKSMTEPITKNG
jgi:hypothetical protein